MKTIGSRVRVTTGELADVLGITPRAVEYARRRGEIDRGKDGLYWLDDAQAGYLTARKGKRKKGSGRGHEGAGDVKVTVRKGRAIGMVARRARAADVVDPVEQGVGVTALTGGQFSLLDVVMQCVERAGVGCDVLIMSWNVGAYDLDQIQAGLSSGKIKRCRMLMDRSFATRREGKAGMWARLLGVVGEANITIGQNHAKVCTVVGGGRHYSIRSSMNLNANRRTEHVDVDDNAQVCAMMDQHLAEIREALGAGGGLASTAADMNKVIAKVYGDDVTDGAKASGKERDAQDIADGDAFVAAATDSLTVAELSTSATPPVDPAEVETLTAIRKRFERAKADKAEMERDEMARHLVDAKAASSAWFSEARAIREQLLGVADRVAANVSASDDPLEVHKMIRAAIVDALLDLQGDRAPHEDRAA